MFRPVTRIKQALSDTECREILKNEKRGVLSVLGDDGYPYGMPINYWYSEKDGRIYFHTGKQMVREAIWQLLLCSNSKCCSFNKRIVL